MNKYAVTQIHYIYYEVDADSAEDAMALARAGEADEIGFDAEMTAEISGPADESHEDNEDDDTDK